jgi:hypothetical protein
MMKKREISQEVFEAMLDGAIDDLRRCGMGYHEIFPVVEECFGIQYARRFCRERGNEEEHEDVSCHKPEAPLP